MYFQKFLEEETFELLSECCRQLFGKFSSSFRQEYNSYEEESNLVVGNVMR